MVPFHDCILQAQYARGDDGDGGLAHCGGGAMVEEVVGDVRMLDDD